MAKTLVNIPNELVSEAMSLTSARSKREVITIALQELVNRRSQLELIDRVRDGDFPDLGDPEVARDARR